MIDFLSDTRHLVWNSKFAFKFFVPMVFRFFNSFIFKATILYFAQRFWEQISLNPVQFRVFLNFKEIFLGKTCYRYKLYQANTNIHTYINICIS